MNQYFIYIMTNSKRGVPYVGMTNNLERRVYEHKNKSTPGFTSKYNCTNLAYYEVGSSPEGAILREKEIKKWRREKKIALIETLNPYWFDLSEKWNFLELGS